MSIFRYPDYHVDPSDIDVFTKEEQLRIYNKILRARAFDLQVIRAVEEKRVIAPVYLSLGQEALAAALSEVVGDFHIFTQHRAHDLYVSLGCDLVEFRDELLGLESGFNGGRTGSSCLRYMKDGIRMYGHHGLIGENVPQAVGAALGSGEKTVCVFGDGAAEEDYVLESLGFAVSRKLPLLFICADNDLSILTHTRERRSWDLTRVAQGFGMEAYDLSDSPWTLLKLLRQWDGSKPLLINCRVCRERWHSGIGIDGEREWKRNEIVRQQLLERGYEREITALEKAATEEMEALWKV